MRTEAPVRFVLRLRIPGWCRGAVYADRRRPRPSRRPRATSAIDREWRPGETVALDLAMPVERIRADPRVAADAGCAALQRGPIVYCLEEKDNGPHLAALALPRGEPLRSQRSDPDLLGGCVVLEGEASARAAGRRPVFERAAGDRADAAARDSLRALGQPRRRRNAGVDPRDVNFPILRGNEETPLENFLIKIR